MNDLSVSLDLKKLPLPKRNRIVTRVQKSKQYYKLENQVLTINYDLAEKIFIDEKERR